MSFRGRCPARVSARIARLLVTATALLAVIMLSSDATASRLRVARSHPAISIVSRPEVQTLETKIVATTHARRPALLLGTATFTITVANRSAFELTNVTVTDPLSPRCNRTIGTLAPGASIAYSCSAANVGRNYTNVVGVSAQPNGEGDLTGTEATATATTATTVLVKPKTKRRVRLHFIPLATG
jgi:uncharacterized repeat protein (TIGR01451 family)